VGDYLLKKMVIVPKAGWDSFSGTVFETTISSLPSPSRSATARPDQPVWTFCVEIWNEPSFEPMYSISLLFCAQETAMSLNPSPFRSPVATRWGPRQPAREKGEPRIVVK